MSTVSAPPPTTLLALDTSSATASVAVFQGQVLAELTWQSGRRHSAQLLPAVATALELANLDKHALGAVAVANGPGSYAGLRVGISTAMALAMSLEIPLLEVSTLEAMAWSAASRGANCGLYRAAVEVGRGRYATASFVVRAGGLADQEAVSGLVLGDLLELAAAESAHLVVSLEQDAWRQAATQYGVKLALVSPAAGVRRAGFLAELAAAKLERGELVGAGVVEPVYLNS